MGSSQPVSAEGGAIEALRQNVARAQELLENKQTTGDLPTLQAATDLASNLLSQDEILAPDVREAHVALAEALAGVSAPAPDAIDKEKLSSLVAEIENMDLSAYTDATVSALKSTLAEAKDAILAEDTTQQELDSLYEKLTSARDNLEFVEASENSSTHSEDLDAESEQNGAPVGDADSDVNGSDGDSSVDGTQTQTADQNQNQNQNSSANGENTIGASQDSQTTSKQVSTGSGTNSSYTATDTTVPLYNDGRSVTYSGNTNEGVVTQTANAQVQPKLADTGIIALVAPATVLGVGAGVAFVVRATKERKTK